MKDTDLVYLTVLLDGGYVSTSMTRKQASDCIKEYYDVREQVRMMSWRKFLYFLIKSWMRPYTLIFGYDTTTHIAVDGRKIIGMCIQGMRSPKEDKLAEDLLRGEEWRDGYSEDDE